MSTKIGIIWLALACLWGNSLAGAEGEKDVQALMQQLTDLKAKYARTGASGTAAEIILAETPAASPDRQQTPA